MPNTAIIKKLKDGSDTIIYPVTVEGAVRDTSGTTLAVKLQGLSETDAANLTEAKSYASGLVTPVANQVNINSGDIQNLQSELELSVVYDVSANNSRATFASLSALLSSANIDTLIPVSVRKGGMSIKFILSSDNKYVQFRLMATEFSTIESDWQGIDNEPTFGSENLVKSGGVYNAIAAKSETLLVEEDGFYVIDEDFNAGMKYDEFGLDTAKVSSHFIEVLKTAGVSVNDIITSYATEVNEDGFFIVDENLNIGVKVDNDGIHAKNILEYEIIED